MILMKASIQEALKEREDWDGTRELPSIYEAMKQLSDSRRKQGQRYRLALVLTYVLIAKAAGETT